MTYLRFFRRAIWLPSLLLLLLFLLEITSTNLSQEQLFLIYGLAFGTLAYPLFATWITRYAQRKTEAEAIRLLWWSPFIFIPFYGIPWILYGLVNLAIGNLAGLAMMFYWVAFFPYILGLGYFFAFITFVVFEAFKLFGFIK